MDIHAGLGQLRREARERPGLVFEQDDLHRLVGVSNPGPRQGSLRLDRITDQHAAGFKNIPVVVVVECLSVDGKDNGKRG